MSYYEDNPYYNPEKFGLTIIGEVEWSEPCYSFDTTVVWEDSEGTLYWASDSGCSCPSPFEDYNSLDDLHTGTAFDLHRHLELCAQQEPDDGAYAAPQIVELMIKVRMR